MKKILLFICFTFQISIYAQTSVTDAAGLGASVPSNACLSCPGSTWNNEMNITLLDGNPADIGLMQHGFCFQSTCFVSRYLAASQFGFTIPLTATIVGIQVDITRKATDTTAIRDSIIQLVQTGSLVGIIKKSGSYWDTSYTTVTYGGPTDLWGSLSGFWTPANINAATSGVDLKIFNTLTVQSQSIYVDYISMTIYFSNSSGIIESQTSESNLFHINQQNNQLLFSFVNQDPKSANQIKLFDAEGRLVFVKMLGLLPAGKHIESADITNLNAGIYLAQYCLGNNLFSKKVILVK